MKKIYHSCQKESDQQCGLLQCQYDKNVDTERRIKNFPLILYPHYYGKDMCAVSSFDVGKSVASKQRFHLYKNTDESAEHCVRLKI